MKEAYFEQTESQKYIRLSVYDPAISSFAVVSAKLGIVSVADGAVKAIVITEVVSV